MEILQFEHDYSDDSQKTDAVYIPSWVTKLGVMIPSLTDADIGMEVLDMRDLFEHEDYKKSVRKIPRAAELGSEEITNGAFTSATTGWTAVGSTLTSEAGGQSGNNLDVASSGDNDGHAKQSLTLRSGHWYKVSWYFKKGTSDTGGMTIGTSDEGTELYDGSGKNDVGWTNYVGYFRVPPLAGHATDTVYVNLETEDASNGENSNFDTITLKECSPLYPALDQGWLPVIDVADGQDAVICASTYDPGYVDITPYIAAIGGSYIRFTMSVAQTADSQWSLYLKS